MNFIYLLIILIPAFTFWLLIHVLIKLLFRPVRPVYVLGIKLRGLIPSNKAGIETFLSNHLRKELLNYDFIHQQLTSPEVLDKVMPVIEKHIDDFLNIKLKQSIPVISMFVGEKIINQLKELFIKELEILFPSVMSHFLKSLSQNPGQEFDIVVKLNPCQLRKFEKDFYEHFKYPLRYLEIMFAASGFLTGILQVILLLIVKN